MDLLNFIIVTLTLIFYLNNTIEKFKPCLNIILVSLLLIAYSTSDTNYIMGTILVLLAFHFFLSNKNIETFKDGPTYHLIDDLDTILRDKNDKTPVVKIKLSNDDLKKIEKTGKFSYPGETSKKDLTADGWRIIKNINNLGDQDNKEDELRIYKIKKVGNRFIKVRMGKNHSQHNSDDDENEEELIMNKIVKENKDKPLEVVEKPVNNTEVTTSSNGGLDIEGFKSKRSKKSKKNSKKNSKKKSKSKRKDYGFDQKFNPDETFINNKETLVDVYKSLDPEQAKGLNSDTRELLETQKNLMSTLKDMGPVLSQGKDIMNTFNKYFKGSPKV